MGQKGFDSLSRFVLAFLAMVALPLASAFALAPGLILGLVYGDGFQRAARPLAFLGIALVAVFANALTTHLLVAAGRNRRLIGAVSTRLLVGLVLDVLLVPRWGAAGAAIAVAGAEWSLLAVSLFWTADLLGFSFAPRRGVSREEVSPCS
ncbi:MAG: polysaccharide biosynthesis C-terminal domain-containing protein, partial [Vicinamibacteria bacterium]